jgi:hypothetical protein
VRSEKHTRSWNQLSTWRNCVVAISNSEVLRNADRESRRSLRRRAREQQCAGTQNRLSEHIDKFMIVVRLSTPSRNGRSSAI